MRKATAMNAAPSRIQLVKVTSSGATAQGYITINTAASSVMVVLSPTATAALPAIGPWHTLWMDPGLPDQTKELTGPFFCQPAPAP